MSKTQKLVIVGDRTIDLDRVVVQIPLSQLAKLIRDAEAATTKKCVSVVKPYVIGTAGRSCVEKLQLEIVEEAPVTETKYVLMDIDSKQPVDDVDFSDVIQTIRRNK